MNEKITDYYTQPIIDCLEARMNDNVSYKMAADYKSYELRQVIQDLKDMASTPNGRKAINPYWEDIYKSHSELVELLNTIPPWEEDDARS